MKPRLILTATLASVFAGGCSSFVHVPPKSSVEVALAKKPEVVAMPALPGMPVRSEPRLTNHRSAYYPAVEPMLPTDDGAASVAMGFTRGEEALQAGRTDDAIQMLEETTRQDSGYLEAWELLALAYEKHGSLVNASEARTKSRGSAAPKPAATVEDGR